MKDKNEILTDGEKIEHIIKIIYEEKGSTFENILKNYVKSRYFNKTPLKINNFDVKYKSSR